MIGTYNPQQLAAMPPLEAGEVHLWKIAIPGIWSGSDAPAFLNPAEQNRFRRYLRVEDARRFASRRIALRCILGRYLECAPTEIVFAAQDATGKPMLDHPYRNRFVFNASSSSDIALIAVAHDGTLGIDVEAMRPFDDMDQIAKRFFTRHEIACWCAFPLEQRCNAFYRLWTAKEALLKAVGTGLPGGLDRFEVSADPAQPPALLRDTQGLSRFHLYGADPGTGYSGALAIGRFDVNVVRFLFDPVDAW